MRVFLNYMVKRNRHKEASPWVHSMSGTLVTQAVKQWIHNLMWRSSQPEGGNDKVVHTYSRQFLIRHYIKLKLKQLKQWLYSRNWFNLVYLLWNNAEERWQPEKWKMGSKDWQQVQNVFPFHVSPLHHGVQSGQYKCINK